MTGMELTTEFSLSKEEFAPFVETLLSLVEGGFILTMTMRRSKSEGSCAFDVTLRSDVLLP